MDLARETSVNRDRVSHELSVPAIKALKCNIIIVYFPFHVTVNVFFFY